MPLLGSVGLLKIYQFALLGSFRPLRLSQWRRICRHELTTRLLIFDQLFLISLVIFDVPKLATACGQVEHFDWLLHYFESNSCFVFCHEKIGLHA
jgi:hypothetical protein